MGTSEVSKEMRIGLLLLPVRRVLRKWQVQTRWLVSVFFRLTGKITPPHPHLCKRIDQSIFEVTKITTPNALLLPVGSADSPCSPRTTPRLNETTLGPPAQGSVSAYGGSSQNLKDLTDAARGQHTGRQQRCGSYWGYWRYWCNWRSGLPSPL